MHINRSAAASAVAMVFLLAGCAARRTSVESAGEVASSTVVTPSNNRSIPAGAQLTTTLDQTLGTNTSKVGDAFTATVVQPLRASDGSIVVPAGAKIDGRVTARDDSDHPADPALLRLAFDRIRFNGQTFAFSAAIVRSNAVQTSSEPSGDRTRQIVIGGAVGAALGGLISGGDLKKVIIGGAIGAAAGSIISMGTEVNASLPAGSQMTLQTTQTTWIR